MKPSTKNLLRRIGNIVITILTALLTSVGAQSCIG